MTRRAYLDHNATSPLKPEARAAMEAAMGLPSNASSIHAEGRAARKALEDARRQVAALARDARAAVYFTSGATEANNWALRAATGRRVIMSAVEHPSARACAGQQIPVDEEGLIDLDALEAALLADSSPALVSVMGVNNETGVIQPVREVAALAHRYGALFHCDGVQMACRLPIRMAELGIDFLTLSSHKIGGPQGAGALVVACGIEIEPWQIGGTQENRRRAGTENVATCVGFGAAAALADASIADQARLASLRDGMEAELRAHVPDLVIFGEGAPRVANTSMLAVPELPAGTQIMALDMESVAVSSGAACSSGKVEPSAVLTAMGVEPALAASGIRVSLGWSTTPEDVAQFVASWQKLRERHAARLSGAA